VLPRASVSRVVIEVIGRPVAGIGHLEGTGGGVGMLLVIGGLPNSACIQLNILLWPLEIVLPWISLPRIQLLDRINAIVHATTLVYSFVSTVEQVKISLLMNSVLLIERHVFKHGVERNLEHIVEHLRKQVAHFLIQVGDLRISIDFNEPDAEVLIDHEIEAEEFERVLSFARVQSRPAGHVTVNGDVFHARDEVPLDLEVVLRVLLVKILLKLIKADNIAFLMHTVCVFVLDLEAIIRQVHVFVVCIDLGGVLLAARTQVADVVKVELIITVCEAPHANVKLTVLEKQWLFNVLLDDPIGELEA
jgi:hypothetical protein